MGKKINGNILIIIMIGIVLLVRSFYSFCGTDECFYLSTTHRFWQGDKPIIDEWNPAQMSAILTLPIYRIYMFFTKGDTEGVVLFARLSYILLTIVVALLLNYVLEKQHSKGAALCCAIIYMMYSRANIYGWSYYNLCLTFFLISLLLLYEAVCNCEIGKSHADILWCVSGGFMACAVICNVYIAPIYILAIGGVLIILREKRMYYYVLGSALPVLSIILFIFARADGENLLASLPNLFADPQHGNSGLVNTFFSLIRHTFGYGYWGVGLKVFIIIWMCMLLRRGVGIWLKKDISCIEKGAVSILILILSLIMLKEGKDIIGLGNLTITIAFIILLTMDIKKKHCKEIVKPIMTFLLPGVTLAIAWGMASNTELDAMTVGGVISAIGVIISTDVIYGRNREENYRIPIGITQVIICLSMVLALALRLVLVYRDDNLWNLNTKIEQGPAKGIYTSKLHAEQYEEIYEVISNLKGSRDNILISRWAPWAYLASDLRCCGHTTWNVPLNSELLEKYYKQYPNKIPQCVFVISEEYGQWNASLWGFGGSEENPNQNSLSGYLYDYIEENQYQQIDFRCGKLYIAKN